MAEKRKKLTSTVSSKGQVTIPKQVRDRLGLAAGSEVEFEVDDGAVHVRKVPASDRGIEKWIGYFQRNGIDFPYKDSLEAVEEMRGRGKSRRPSIPTSSSTFCRMTPYLRLVREIA